MMQNPLLEGDSFFWRAGNQGVLLVHGFTATTAEVRPLAQFLHAAGYSVSGVLLPGHGTTAEEANRFTWMDWNASIDQAYQQLRQSCEHLTIAGESLGGLLTLFQASITPEFEKVVVYAPALKLRSKWAGRLAHLLAPFLPVLQKPASPPTQADELWQGYTVYPLKAMLQLLKLQKVVTERLPGIRQPLLIVQGRLDQTVDPGVPEHIRSQVNSTRVEVNWFEKSGHCVILDEERQKVMETTINFLQS